MAISKTASLIIYRIREKGLEVFLVNPEKEGNKWQLPQRNVADEQAIAVSDQEKFIALDPIHQSDGKVEEGIAVEGDWHDIPSLKSLVLEDVQFMKDQIMQMIPDVMDKGAFFAVKEAFKRVLPHQYEMLKELKDIITDRNSVQNM
jgi:predicted NUDIX family NTP pyrophosphohydrolase